MFWENLLESFRLQSVMNWPTRQLCRVAYHQAEIEDETEAEQLERFHDQCWGNAYLPRILTTRI